MTPGCVSHTGLTLRDILKRHSERFYAQTWYLDEPFLDRQWPPLLRTSPSQVVDCAAVSDADRLPSASQLAFLYVCDPHATVWGRYLWCSDLDSLGQRIYVGANGKGLEIHRHLHITSRWGIPTWP